MEQTALQCGTETPEADVYTAQDPFGELIALTDEEAAALDRLPAFDACDEKLTDAYGLPFEPEDAVRSDPLEFEEMTSALWRLVNRVHYAATRYNRCSPYYLMLIYRLEKLIRHMGSYCITRAVLEQSGKTFPKLEGLSIKELYCMVSLHFRKCCMAFDTISESRQGQDMTIAGWVFRWAALAERLRSTQQKIDDIRAGKLNAERLLARADYYRDDPDRGRKDSSTRRIGPRMKAASLPVIKSYARSVRVDKRYEERRERAERKEAERRMQKKISGIYPTIPLDEKYDHKTRIWEIRAELMSDAQSRNDLAEVRIIAREDEEQLLERYRKYREAQQFPVRPLPAPVRSARPAPDDETRRKLREKRKKKK